ncbi:MAG: hypothetical protein MUF52_07250 [Syntrophobacteraceae bacterium]|nr:hypothetical protein [Syntrophobacteraceae bacterium]
MKSRYFQCVLMSWLLLVAPALSMAEDTGTISYKIGSKTFSFKDARLEYSAGDSYLTLTREGSEEISDPADPKRKVDVGVGLSIELAVEEKAVVGVHEAKSADTMPVYFSWYEVFTDKETNEKMLRDILASLDAEDEKKQSFRLKIDNFGPPGTVIKGSFSGKLLDEDGNVREVTDGVFAIPRVDVKAQ